MRFVAIKERTSVESANLLRASVDFDRMFKNETLHGRRYGFITRFAKGFSFAVQHELADCATKSQHTGRSEDLYMDDAQILWN